MRRAALIALGLTSMLAVAGCETTPPPAETLQPRPVYAPPPPPPPTVYRPEDFAWSVGQGPNAILGEVAYHPRPGERWTCAGQSVGLTPATPYSIERMRVLYGSSFEAVEPIASVTSRAAEHPGVNYGRFLRTTTCDDHNAFAFMSLPNGRYFVITRVRPAGEPAGGRGEFVLMRSVEVRGGLTKRMVLPEPPPH